MTGRGGCTEERLGGSIAAETCLARTTFLRFMSLARNSAMMVAPESSRSFVSRLRDWGEQGESRRGVGASPRVSVT